MSLLDEPDTKVVTPENIDRQETVLAQDPDARSVSGTSAEPHPVAGSTPTGVGVAAAEVILVDLREAPGTCRRMALDHARSALAVMSAAGEADRPRIVLRAYDVGEGGGGGLVVVLGGRFDAAAADRLQGRCAELRRRAKTELVVECGALSPECHSALARTVARLRLQALVDGRRVELHHAPATVLAELGHHRTAPVTALEEPVVATFGVTDSDDTGRRQV